MKRHIIYDWKLAAWYEPARGLYHRLLLSKDSTTEPEGFASVMATMSARGEDLQSWQEACEYLKRPATA